MEYNQPKKTVKGLATKHCQRSAMCFKSGGNHLWVNCQAGRHSSYGSYFENSHSVSSPYRYEDSYGTILTLVGMNTLIMTAMKVK